MAPHGSRGFSIFLSNVPVVLTDDQSLDRELRPFLVKLGIQDWSCDKPRNKQFGIVNFLHRLEGQKFLKEHGELPIPGAFYQGRPRMKARLFLLRKPIFCKENEREIDATLLKSLEFMAEERKRPQKYDAEPQKHQYVTFATRALSCGHYEYPKGTLAYKPDIDWYAQGGIAKFVRNALIIYFPYERCRIRLEIPYRMIHEIVISDRPVSLLLTLVEPPKIFLLPNSDAEHELSNLLGNLAIANSPKPVRSQDRWRLSKIPHTGADHGQIIGQSLIYAISLSPEDAVSKMERLKQNEYLNITTYRVPLPSSGLTYMADELANFKSAVRAYSQAIPFDILYQFEALVQNGYIVPRTAHELLNWFRQCIPRNRPPGAALPFSALAIKQLFLQTPFPGPYVNAENFDTNEIWSLLRSNEEEIQHGLTKELFSERNRQNLTMVHKVQVTPTRILLAGPEPEAKNRILRKFPRHTGYFARIQFCDEDGQDLYFSPKVSLEQTYDRFKKILSDGFPIAGRLYKFLGFSHSSLRSHAVWFMASFVDDNLLLRSYATVIPELGDFKGIRAARIGQAFSETPIAINLDELNTRIPLIPDVKSADGSRMFSDGVGTISWDLLEAVRDAMPKAENATCLQIRWAGAKGMLSLDVRLRGYVMNVRESMNKFLSADRQNLEICDVANKPIPLVLNRQMIKILEDMRVPDVWFIKAQNRELDRLRKITAITNNTVTFLKRQKIAEQLHLHRFIRRLHMLQMDYKKDAFLCSVVEAVVLREVRLLKHKSRIPIEQGVTLFGVMDEFGYLDDEDVFITFDKQQGVTYPDFNERLVIVTRSPALHPGDIQIRKAVVPPLGHPLRSLSNCIVFSQKGDRDLPSQLSGGDLDGDIYNIIWDPIAVEGCEREFEPADYPRVQPLDIGRDVEAKDMTEFFVNFMATDQLGVIATRHIILADLHAAGTVHDDCQLLAEMHSTAVDYSKTGIPVQMSKMASLKRARFRPDFLAPAPPAHIVDKAAIEFEAPLAPSEEIDEDDETGPKHRFYLSDKILGKLYRAIDEKKLWKEDIHLDVNRSGSSLWDDLFVYINRECRDYIGVVNWKRALEEAHKIRQAYDSMVRTAAADFSDHSTKPITELEVFTGMIFNKSGVQTRRQRDNSIRLKDEFDRITKCIEGYIRKPYGNQSQDVAESVAGESHDGYYEESIAPEREFTALELSIACLWAGTTKDTRHSSRKGDDMEFESFKIIAAHCVLRELEIAVKQRDIADGAAAMSGGYIGVRSGRT